MASTKSVRATTSKLEMGDDTIMRSTPRKQPDGTFWIDWSFQPSDGSKRLRRRSKGNTIGETRRRAREQLAELKALNGSGTWKLSSDMVKYINSTSSPAIEKADLAKLTRDRYEIALRLLTGDCELHRHKHDFRKHTIGSGARFKPLEDLLTEIASLHGRETARQARTVLTKYVLTPLTRDELIAGNPIAGISLNQLTGTKPGERVRGGKALSRTEYDAVITYLLDLDPATGVVRKQGRWTFEQLVARRRNAIDQALFQAATGLRAMEANGVTWEDHIGTRDDGVMYVNVTDDIAKGGIARVALVLDQRVAQHLLARRERAASPNSYVIGSPIDSRTPWDRNNSNKAARGLYLEIAKALKIEILENERSHMWRTTLHTLYGGGSVPTAVLDSQFGNSEKVRSKHYTDASDLTSLSDAAGLKAS